jgi:hypothetical protein
MAGFKDLIEPMTLGNMRANGVRSLAILSADPWPDHVRCGSGRHPLFKHSARLVT